MLLVALALVTALAFVRSEDETARPAEARPAPGGRPVPRTVSVPAPPAFDPGRLDRLAQRTRSEQAPVDLFAAEVPAPPPGAASAQSLQPPAPPPPPQAPELPFRYLGTQEAGGVQTLFLEQRQETHIVKVGDTVGNAWRLDGLNARTAVFTYVPLGQQRTLALGGPG